MTEPSQYFKGRTVQEQMNEVIGYVDTRAAEVATTAIASDVAQVHQDMLDADADAAAAAASAAAAAGTLANAVKKTGESSQSIAGDIAVAGDLSAGGDLAVTGDISGGTVTVPTPVNNTDAANKKYVDDQDTLKISIADINSYAVGLTGNQGPIAGNKEFSGIMINATIAPTFSKLPENTGGKYLALFEFQGQTIMSLRAIAGVSNTVAVFDLRNSSATCGVITHAITGERYIAPGDFIICTNDASNKKWTVFVKYPQNRRLMIFIDTINSMFGNISLNPGQITSVFTGTLIDDPSADYSEVVTGIPLELKSS